MIEITFIGTSSMVPTKERNQSSVLISYKNHGIMVDCGEGTQRQLKILGIPLTKVTKILITHWHGDHVLGLPGLIQSMSASDYNKTLEIYGPEGTKKRFDAMFSAFIFDKKMEITIQEISDGNFFENDDIVLEAMKLEHGIETLGYNFIEKDRTKIDIKKVKKFGIPEGPLLGMLQENKTIEWKGKMISPKEATYVLKGKKITIIADTSLCSSCYKLAKNADLLVCEATYSSKLEEKGEAYGHMTAKQAALIANKSNAKKLVLTHFSARYKDDNEIKEDAKNFFDDVVCAYDFMKVRI